MPQVGACLLTSGSTCLQVGLLNRGLTRSFGWGPITSRRDHSAVGHPAGGQRAPGRRPIYFGVNLLAGGVIKQGFKKTQVSRSAGIQLLQEGATQLWVFQLGGQRASSGLAGYHRAPGTAMRGGGVHLCPR